MTFADLVVGEAVVLDANTLVYHIIHDPQYGPACSALLMRIEQGDLQGFTSAHVLAEMAHALMTHEACGLFSWPIQGAANRLRRHPAQVQQLGLYRRALDEVSLLPLTRLPVTGPLVSLAADVTRQYGLLTNDALIVSLMQQNRLTALASLDADFDRVPGLTRYAPA
jgi:predicted nucleic acid-binding protein